MLPKFLLADNSQNDPDMLYVVHTEQPRCIFEAKLDHDFYENHSTHWIDPEPENKLIIENIVNQAEKFIEDELDNQERLYDLEFDKEE